MKLHCEYFVLCERLIEDAHSHTMTAVGLLERVNALVFPSVHHGFACAARLRVEGAPPAKAVPMAYRIVRACEADGEEVIAELEGEWTAGSRTARVVASFQTLRLKRDEVLTFRLEYRIGAAKKWTAGPEVTLEIARIELPAVDKARLVEELKAKGLPVPDLR